MKLLAPLMVLLLVATVNNVRADTISVSLLELQQALDSAESNPDKVSQQVMNKVSELINDAAISFNEGELVYTLNDENVNLEGGCNRTDILSIETVVVLLSDSTLSFTLNSLYDPITIGVNVNATISSNGVARQTVGIRVGDCQNLARDSFSFSAQGPAGFTLSLQLQLNPKWVGENELLLTPSVSLSGEILSFQPTVSVDETVLANLLESYLLEQIETAFSNNNLAESLTELELRLNNDLSTQLDNGTILIRLPEASNDQLLALYRLLQPEARFPISLEMIRQRKQELLAAVLFGEPGSIDQLFADAALCESAASFLNTHNGNNLYSSENGQCQTVVSPENKEGTLWADDACSQPIDYYGTSIAEFCFTALQQDRLGNAQSLSQQLTRWTHSPGSRFDIGALSIKGKPQPLMQRREYKRIETGQGLCSLEMRIYTPSLTQRPLKPLIALHGGSWQNRASGFVGIESTATHFTNQGFVVFAPFYRLIGNSDGPLACQNATLDELEQDVNGAFNWVLAHMHEYGIEGAPVVFGQSAGGHLALSLAVNRPSEVDRAILFYAPTDFSDFASQINAGEYLNPAGVRILEKVSNSRVDELDMESDLVQRNSFPNRVLTSTEAIPPMFILHGELDSLLPFRQSVRLCNALHGSADLNHGIVSSMPVLTGLSRRITCGQNGSELHLIAEGEHALDLCLAPGLCLAGSVESANAVASSIESMLRWSTAELIVESARKSGVGVLNVVIILCGCFIILIRRRD